jgi:hypothetical protein
MAVSKACSRTAEDRKTVSAVKDSEDEKEKRNKMNKEWGMKEAKE